MSVKDEGEDESVMRVLVLHRPALHDHQFLFVTALCTYVPLPIYTYMCIAVQTSIAVHKPDEILIDSVADRDHPPSLFTLVPHDSVLHFSACMCISTVWPIPNFTFGLCGPSLTLH